MITNIVYNIEDQSLRNEDLKIIFKRMKNIGRPIAEISENKDVDNFIQVWAHRIDVYIQVRCFVGEDGEEYTYERIKHLIDKYYEDQLKLKRLKMEYSDMMFVVFNDIDRGWSVNINWRDFESQLSQDMFYSDEGQARVMRILEEGDRFDILNHVTETATKIFGTPVMKKKRGGNW